jgi:hypothetical protein
MKDIEDGVLYIATANAYMLYYMAPMTAYEASRLYFMHPNTPRRSKPSLRTSNHWRLTNPPSRALEQTHPRTKLTPLLNHVTRRVASNICHDGALWVGHHR